MFPSSFRGGESMRRKLKTDLSWRQRTDMLWRTKIDLCLWPLLATVAMVAFFACFERMCEIRHTRDSYTNRRFLSLRIMARCFSHEGANCEMQIPNYLYSEKGCCQEPITTPTIVMTCYWINHILLNLLTSRMHHYFWHTVNQIMVMLPSELKGL